MPSYFERWHHQRERFLLAMLALAKMRYGVGTAGIGEKLESSDAFERNDLTLQKGFDRIFDGAVELRPAHQAGIGLRVEAAVRWVLVFLATHRTQCELLHRGVRPVVRDVDDNGVARSAIGAIGERVFKAAIAGIEQFLAAVGAGGQVGEKVDRFAGIALAGENLKPGRALRGKPGGFADS